MCRALCHRCKRADPFSQISQPSKEASVADKFYRYVPYDERSDQFLLHSEEAILSSSSRAVNACIRLFCAIFLEQSAHHKEQLTSHFRSIIKKVKNSNEDNPLVTNIITVLLAICRELNKRKALSHRREGNQSTAGLNSQKASGYILEICVDLIGWPTPHVRRAVGESLGILASIEGDAFTARVFKIIQKYLEAANPPLVKAGAAFSLGCVHRYVGHMKTIKYQTFTVAALQALGSCRSFCA